MRKINLIIGLLALWVGYSKNCSGQERRCDFHLLRDTLITLPHYKNEPNDMVLLYRINKINIKVSYEEILTWKDRFSMTEKEIKKRVEWIKNSKIASDTSDFLFAKEAAYVARRVLEKGKAMVSYEGKLEKSFRLTLYKSENCLEYIKFEFEPNVYFKEAVVF